MLSVREIAKTIDISAVQAFHGETEIRELVSRAREYEFVAVHALPCWVPLLRNLVLPADSILIGAPVGFPGGGHTTQVKVSEATHLESAGVQEMDLMMNVGKARSGDWSYVEQEITEVVSSVSVPVKVILEVHYLTAEQIRRACEVCIKGGAAFIKTSTGWADTGASLDVIRLITGFVDGAIQIKAAGGVRNLETLLEMHRMGVSRFGINLQASMRIIDQARQVESV